MHLNGFFDDLLQTTEKIATSVINRPQPVYTQPTFPYGSYTMQRVATAMPDTSTLMTLAAVGLGIYLLMGSGRRGRRGRR